MQVRRLEKKDIPCVLAMAKDFQENYLFKKCGFSEKKVLALLELCLNPNSSYFLVVGEVDKKIRGAFCGRVSEYYFSTYKIASDVAIYVNPEDRKFSLKFLNRSIEEFEKWSKSWGVTEISIAHSSGEYSGTFEKFLKRKNYDNIGFIAKKGI